MTKNEGKVEKISQARWARFKIRIQAIVLGYVKGK